MIITTSRNAMIFEKSFSKHLAEVFPDTKHVPRGQTPLKKIFEKSSYLGNIFLLVVCKKKDNLELVIYKRKVKDYFPDKVFLLGEVFYKKPKGEIQDIKTKGKFFYFFENTDKDSENKGIQEGNQITFSKAKEVFFSFKILKEENL